MFDGPPAIRYDQHGTGPLLVWIAGTGLTGRIWSKYQVDSFADRFTCVTVDLPGVGESPVPEFALTVAELASAIGALLRHLDAGPAHIVGLSLGSAIAQELAISDPTAVASLVLLSTWSSTSREHHLRRWFEGRRLSLKTGLREVYAAYSFWLLSPTVIDNHPARAAEIEAFLSECVGPGNVGAIQHLTADLLHETRDRLNVISAPTLVIHGSDDLITLPQYNNIVASLIPRAITRVLPDAGHLAWLEAPAAFNHEVAAFLRCVPDRLSEGAR